jgi:hypothetical protein
VPITASSSQWCQPRRLLQPNRQTVIASAVNGRNGREPGCKAEDCALLEIVSWVVAGEPEGVTVAGLKAHVAPVGSPEHAKLTVESNPFPGVTVSVTVPCSVAVPVSEVGEAVSVKKGCWVMV